MKSCANCKHKVNICCGEWNTLGCSKIGVRITEPDRIFGINRVEYKACSFVVEDCDNECLYEPTILTQVLNFFRGD